MCGVTLNDRKSCEELRQRLRIDSVSAVLRRNSRIWFGHKERKNDDDLVKACHRLEVACGREVEAPVIRRADNILRRT